MPRTGNRKVYKHNLPRLLNSLAYLKGEKTIRVNSEDVEND